jgi:uncharacterized lipoprotein YmbA
MRTKTTAAAQCLLASLALVICACSLIGPGQRPAPRLYLLSSLATAAPPVVPAAKLPHLSIGIGPVRLAEYLDRRSIIMRNSDNGIELLELSQWAEPLSESFARAMADNLSVLLGTQRVFHFPWRSAVPVDYQVAFHVVQFDGHPQEQVLLRAHWQVFKGDGQTLLDSGHALIRETVAEPSVEAFIAAHSRAVAQLSRDVAGVVVKRAG